MPIVTVRETISASALEVFQMLADPEQSIRFDPDVLGVEYITDFKAAPGARFRQRRKGPKGSEMSLCLEIREYEPPLRARMVTQTNGTEWDTLYTFEEDEEGRTRVTLEMAARSDSLLKSFMNGLMRGLFRRGIAKHMAAAKMRLETHSPTEVTGHV
ncbi:MAG: SRPBCC family protein [Myxococcota bacterium]